MKNNSLFRRILVIVVYLFGTATTLAYLVMAVQSSQALVLASQSGDLDLSFNDHDGFLIASEVSKSDFSSDVVPKIGDTLLTFDGAALEYDSAFALINGPLEPGRKIQLTYQENGDTLSATMVAKRTSTKALLGVGWIHVVKYLLVIAFVAISFIALWRRPDSVPVRVLALFSFALPVIVVTGVRYEIGMMPEYSRWIEGFSEFMFSLDTALFSSFWLNLALLFPQPRKIMIDRKWLGYLICYLPQALILLTFSMIPGLSEEFGIIVLIVVIAQMTAGFILLGNAHRRAKDAMVKRQTRIVMYGTMAGISPFTLVILTVLVFGQTVLRIFPGGLYALILLIFLSFWAIPLSFLIAFNRYGLFNVEAKLRRGTRYVLTIALLLAVLLVIVMLASNLMVNVLGITDRTPVLVLAVAMAAGVMPVQRRVQTWLENQFYPERRKLRAFVSSFVRRATTMPDRAALLGELADSLSQGLGVEEVIPGYFDSDSGLRDLEMNPIPLRERGILLHDLMQQGNPILIDELLAEEGDELGVEEREWLDANKVNLLLPLVASSGLKGVVALGGRKGEESFRAEEIQILGTLGGQVALAMDNLTLLEENLEKRRLQEQLDLARDIQQGFLPQSIPDTPGLEVAATSLFSLEVAGDYYDVILGKSGRTVFAVGDVSGKGAGAALIMANLQASLRALVSVDANLSKMVAGINDIIYQNTPMESYITFFAGIFDAGSRKLSYVNAGHNPPMLIRTHANRAEELTSGGLILGMMPGAVYKTGRVELKTGDLLLLFTDGVTEAMNSSEEEFGEQRLLDIVLKNRKLPTEEIVNAVRKEVIKFSGSDHFDDDFTMLVLRAVSPSRAGRGAKAGAKSASGKPKAKKKRG